MNHLPKNYFKLPKFYETVERKRGSYDALTMAYIWRENIFTYEINDTTHIIVDYGVGICPFSVNKCNVADMLLPHCAAEVLLRNGLNERSAKHRDLAGMTATICTTLENAGNISNRSFSCIAS